MTTPTERVINRHMARTLTELEDANCPVVYLDAVRRNMCWLRSDLLELDKEGGGNNDGKR
jgi:demethoxyubiquinone hydroxylase (CLK1/Coq7/Cat5 family)